MQGKNDRFILLAILIAATFFTLEVARSPLIQGRDLGSTILVLTVFGGIYLVIIMIVSIAFFSPGARAERQSEQMMRRWEAEDKKEWMGGN